MFIPLSSNNQTNKWLITNHTGAVPRQGLLLCRHIQVHLNKLECCGKLWWFCLTFNKNPPILNKLEYFIRPIIKKKKLWIVGLLESMFSYCICTQYLVGAPFAFITASIRRGMEVISLWHCSGGYGSPGFFDSGLQLICIFWSLVSHFPLDKILYGVQVWWVCWPVNTSTPWSFNQILVLLAMWAGDKSCWKMKSASLKSWSGEAWSALKFLVNGCSDIGFQKTQCTNTSRWYCTPNHHRLWKLNTGLQATWAMSFSTLPPDSRTLVSKWYKTCSHLKRGLWTTGQQSSSSSP